VYVCFGNIIERSFGHISTRLTQVIALQCSYVSGKSLHKNRKTSSKTKSWAASTTKRSHG